MLLLVVMMMVSVGKQNSKGADKQVQQRWVKKMLTMRESIG